MDINKILTRSKTIAIVGISDKPERYSYQVAKYLQKSGYRIIPINPNISKTLGEKSYPDLSSVPKTIPIDIVDIFRKPQFIPQHIKEAVLLKDLKMIWIQEKIKDSLTQKFSKKYHIPITNSICLMQYHKAIQKEKI